ncbi:MAG TPA: hypothetical protein DIU05_08500 [Bacteroidetes bacterium]|nr:hypothetical protein [Bacteroidota bacterium]
MADDTISIQNAINSGLPVFIPPGRYKKRKQLICLQMIFLARVLHLLSLRFTEPTDFKHLFQEIDLQLKSVVLKLLPTTNHVIIIVQ